MRRPGIGSFMLLALMGHGTAATSAALPPSADPVTTFISVADSVYRTEGDAGLSTFLKDNSILVGAGVAKLLDVAFQVGQQGEAAAEKENVDFAKHIALSHEKVNGSAVARGLVDTYTKWTKSQRAQRAQAIALEEESSAARKAGDAAKSIDLLMQARAVYEKIRDRHSVAVNLGTMGIARWSTGEWDVIIAGYEQALAARRAVEDRILEGRTLNGLGSAYQQKADWARAADYYRQAIELRKRTGDLTGLGTSITYLGHVYYNTGRYVDARRQYEEALPIVEALNNPSQSVDLLGGIAAVNASIGRLDDSRDAYARAITLANQNGLADKEITLRRSLADAERTEGRFTNALDQLAAADALLATYPNAMEQTQLHLNRGLTYMNMGELEDARVDLLKSAELAATLDDPGPAILAQTSIAYLYGELGAYDRGLSAADKARELSEKAADGRGYREAMAIRADLQFRMGRHDEALASWQEALAQDQADGAEQLALMDEIAIAGMRLAKGETETARAALRALGPRVQTAEYMNARLAMLSAMGHSFEKESPDSAAYYYELALADREAKGLSIGGSEVQTGYLSGRNRYYFEEVARYYASQAVAASEAGNGLWTNRAFRTMERAKARGLVDLLRDSVAGRSSVEENAALDALYSLDPSAPDYASQRAALEQKYLDLRRTRVDKAVAGLSGASVVGIDDVARTLPKKTVLFEYALGDSSSLLWVIDRDRSEMHRLPPRPKIEAEVRRFRDAVAKPGSGDATMLASARSLYRTLVEPGAARLRKAETVVIVPDGILFELPYDALLATEPNGGGMRKQSFLTRTHATACVPSATVYVRLRSDNREREYARDLFAVGNPDFSGLSNGGEEPLAPLPFAEKEVQAIGTRVKTARRTTLTGSGATEAAVKQELRTESPRVVHLATHGLVDANEPARSSVALTPGAGEDGFFHTLEIISTPTTSGLVVMSACESARGRVSRGEGVVGLSRAFLGAGAESVVASLWSVSDESTADLMGVFYDRMFGKKRPASRALREARVALLDSEKFSHPFFWSPFVVTGTERSPW